MPAALVDVTAVLALAGLLVVAFVHPRGRVEAGTGLAAAALMLGIGAVTWAVAEDAVRELFPVVAFLAAILVVAELCAAEGVFAAVGDVVARAARGRPQRMLLLTFAAAALTTAALSLDATVVLLTPVVAAAATRGGVRSRPTTFACVRLANSASLLLPVSNLTNLLALPHLHLSFVRFALLMAPVWVAVLLVEYGAQRFYFRRDLHVTSETPDDLPRHALSVVPLVVVGLMLVGFAVASPFDVAPAWVAAVAAVVLAGWSLTRRTVDLATVARSTHLTFTVFVLGLGVVVAALTRSFLGDLVADLVPSGSGLLGLAAVALLATVLANLVNNLPATLLVLPVVAPLGQTAVLAALLGLNIGSGLTYPGSLANLLWRRTLGRHGERPSARDFHRLSLVVTPPTLAIAVVVLWAWAGLLAP